MSKKKIYILCHIYFITKLPKIIEINKDMERKSNQIRPKSFFTIAPRIRILLKILTMRINFTFL